MALRRQNKKSLTPFSRGDDVRLEINSSKRITNIILCNTLIYLNKHAADKKYLLNLEENIKKSIGFYVLLRDSTVLHLQSAISGYFHRIAAQVAIIAITVEAAAAAAAVAAVVIAVLIATATAAATNCCCRSWWLWCWQSYCQQ